MLVKIFLSLIILFGFLPACLLAEDSLFELKATVDKDTLRVGEYCNYRLVISSDASIDSSKMRFPDLKKDFEIISSGNFKNITISGGRTVSQMIFEYVLTPDREGVITIEPAELTYRGKVYKTQPINVQVNQQQKALPDYLQDEKMQKRYPAKEEVTL